MGDPTTLEVTMPVNKQYLRETLTIVFGSCPLSDEFIDDIDETSYYAIDTLAECQRYIRDELKIPYTELYQKIIDKNK